MSSHYLITTVDHVRLAIALDDVERVERAAEIVPLPQSPAVVLGALNYRGVIRPVLSPRVKFSFQQDPVAPSDVFVLVKGGRREAVLLVDAVQNVLEVDESVWVDVDKVLDSEAAVQGVLRLPDGMAVIHNMERFLSPHEQDELTRALDATATDQPQ